jgi:hypothetical protein
MAKVRGQKGCTCCSCDADCSTPRCRACINTPRSITATVTTAPTEPFLVGKPVVLTPTSHTEHHTHCHYDGTLVRPLIPADPPTAEIPAVTYAYSLTMILGMTPDGGLATRRFAFTRYSLAITAPISSVWPSGFHQTQTLGDADDGDHTCDACPIRILTGTVGEEDEECGAQTKGDCCIPQYLALSFWYEGDVHFPGAITCPDCSEVEPPDPALLWGTLLVRQGDELRWADDTCKPVMMNVQKAGMQPCIFGKTTIEPELDEDSHKTGKLLLKLYIDSDGDGTADDDPFWIGRNNGETGGTGKYEHIGGCGCDEDGDCSDAYTPPGMCGDGTIPCPPLDQIIAYQICPVCMAGTPCGICETCNIANADDDALDALDDGFTALPDSIQLTVGSFECTPPQPFGECSGDSVVTFTGGTVSLPRSGDCTYELADAFGVSLDGPGDRECGDNPFHFAADVKATVQAVGSGQWSVTLSFVWIETWTNQGLSAVADSCCASGGGDGEFDGWFENVSGTPPLCGSSEGQSYLVEVS